MTRKQILLAVLFVIANLAALHFQSLMFRTYHFYTLITLTFHFAILLFFPYKKIFFSNSKNN
jgi:hypothetical protein